MGTIVLTRASAPPSYTNALQEYEEGIEAFTEFALSAAEGIEEIENTLENLQTENFASTLALELGPKRIPVDLKEALITVTKGSEKQREILDEHIPKEISKKLTTERKDIADLLERPDILPSDVRALSDESKHILVALISHTKRNELTGVQENKTNSIKRILEVYGQYERTQKESSHEFQALYVEEPTLQNLVNELTVTRNFYSRELFQELLKEAAQNIPQLREEITKYIPFLNKNLNEKPLLEKVFAILFSRVEEKIQTDFQKEIDKESYNVHEKAIFRILKDNPIVRDQLIAGFEPKKETHKSRVIHDVREKTLRVQKEFAKKPPLWQTICKVVLCVLVIGLFIFSFDDKVREINLTKQEEETLKDVFNVQSVHDLYEKRFEILRDSGF